MKRHLKALPGWILTVITIGVILWLTLSPDPVDTKDLPLFPGADKIVHGLMFGFLTFVALLDWTRGRDFRSVSPKVIFITATLSTLLGILIEYAQRGMALGRSYDELDMLADAIGAFSVAGGWYIAEKIRKRRMPK